MRIDHVVWGTRDFDAASADLARLLRQEPIEGGRHPQWGTGNRLLPLGTDYVELLGVVDPSVAAGSSFGRRLLDLREDGWFAFCVEDPNLERTAERLGLNVVGGGRELPSGETVRWESAGLEAPQRGDSLPFFIRWDVPPELHPSRMREAEPGWSIERVVIGDAPEALRLWLGDVEIPIVATGDGRGVGPVTVRSPRGSIEIA